MSSDRDYRMRTTRAILATRCVRCSAGAGDWIRREAGRRRDGARRGGDRSRRAARIEQARQQILDEAYQPNLPDGGEGSGSGGVRRPGRQAGGELADRDHRRRVDVRMHDDEPGPMSAVMNVVLWGMVIVISVLGGFWLASELSKYGGDAELPPEIPDAHAAAIADAIIERPLEDAEELARRGLFAEAIHTLLLRTLQELARTAAVRVAPATTSREILARVPLLADARSALAGLITAVEITHFGDEPANADDYERCRRQFHVFAAAFRQGGQAPQTAVA
jgi:hypothetical protein